MNSSTEKYLRILVALFAALATIFWVWSVIEGDTAIADDPSLGDKIVSPFLWVAYIALFIAAGTAIVYSLVNTFRDPKKAKGALYGIGALLLVLGIGYGIASGDDLQNYAESLEVTESMSKWSGTGLNAFYIVFLVSVVGILYVEVSKAFK